jgi:transcriptional regulator of NAD metabolism
MSELKYNDNVLKIASELEMEQENLYELISGICKHNIYDLNRLLEIERELTLMEDK